MKELIAANEIRIGNLYNDNGVFKKASPSTIEEVWNAPRSWCKAIPLTEEWLLKFGFEKIKDFNVYINVWELKGFMVSLGEYINIHVDWADDGADNYHSIVVYEELYVHTLQNLYFALTGEELTIKQQEQ